MEMYKHTSVLWSFLITLNATLACRLYYFNLFEGIVDKCLVGFTYQIHDVTEMECFKLCREDCTCDAFQMGFKRCELLNNTRYQSPESFLSSYGYKYYDLKRSNDMNGCISKRCCSNNPCLQGARCEEQCDGTHLRTKCHCPVGYTGRYCERTATSCRDFRQTTQINGRYKVFDSNNQLYTVYCDFTSEKNWTWTLVVSYSKSNVVAHRVPFFTNKPIDEENPNWIRYRMSLTKMNALKTVSTHWRAACNFESTGIDYTDYLRGSFSVIDMIAYNGEQGCVQIEYINVRGYSCSSCSANMIQTGTKPFHIDTYYSLVRGCDFYAGPEAYTGGGGEDTFGAYYSSVGGYRCSDTSDSTTSFWIGEK